ncbi:unnamed protein product [Gadus morhua 'NCC']
MLLNAGWNRAKEEDRLSRLGRIARSWLGSWLVGASLALLRIPFVSALLYHLARSWRRERLCRGSYFRYATRGRDGDRGQQLAQTN